MMITPETADLILVLADNKHQLGLRYAEWATGAPTLEAATAAAAMSQAELGHARALLPLLRDATPPIDEERAPERFVRLLDKPFASWADFVAANAIFDAALTTIVMGLAESSYVPLRGRAKKIVEEERYHAAHGSGWLRRLGQSGAGARLAIEEAVAGIWVETLCLFGPEDDPLLQSLYQAGVVAASPGELRDQFLARLRPTLDAAGLAPAEVGALPWGGWDAPRRRLR
jgi:phenylacetate-CoA oxygenase PaaI subunit